MPDPWTGEIAGPYYSARGHRLALGQGQSCSLATSPAITGFRVVGIEREVPGEGTVQPPGQEYRSSRRMPVRQLPTKLFNFVNYIQPNAANVQWQNRSRDKHSCLSPRFAEPHVPRRFAAKDRQECRSLLPRLVTTQVATSDPACPGLPQSGPSPDERPPRESPRGVGLHHRMGRSVNIANGHGGPPLLRPACSPCLT